MNVPVKSDPSISNNDRSNMGFSLQVRSLKKQDVVFLLLALSGLVVLFFSYYQMVHSPVQRQYYSHLIFIPLISAYFGYQVRSEVASDQDISISRGLPIAAAGMTIAVTGWFFTGKLSLLDSAAAMNFGAVVFITGSFVACYGGRSFRHAMFPLLFLLFAVPLPSAVMHQVIQFLQEWTSEVSEPLFRLTGVPFAREGNFFNLGGITVEVAEECSGIRSSMSLMILSVMAGKMMLESGWRRFMLAVSVIPITIFKNGVRVVTLSLLGAYVDERILTHSTIHSNSGVLIFILPLTMLGLVLWLLKRGERKTIKPAN